MPGLAGAGGISGLGSCLLLLFGQRGLGVGVVVGHGGAGEQGQARAERVIFFIMM